MVASLTLEFVRATLGPGGEELLEGFLIGGQVLLEAVHRLFVTLTGLLPAKAAATHGASTCGDTGVTGGLVVHPTAGFKVGGRAGDLGGTTGAKGRGKEEKECGGALSLFTTLPNRILPRCNEQTPRSG